jgi:ELWxxDGT repeat protein
MRRRSPLQVELLEDRDVPSASMVTDLHGIWGSYPLNLTVSGNTLFFSADDGHGYELYATKGAPGDVYMVKQINPNLGGSNPTDFISAGDGVIYFTAYNGTSTAMWRSDGSAARTVELPPLPSYETLGGEDFYADFTGLNGDLYFLTTNNNNGNPELWMTNGATNTLLLEIYQPGWTLPQPTIGISNGEITVTEYVVNWSGLPDVWVSNGTPAGSMLQQVPLDTNPMPPEPPPGEPQDYNLPQGIEVSPGVIIHPDFPAIWESDGLDQSSVHQIATIPITLPVNESVTGENFVSIGNQLYFLVDSTDPSTEGLWVTDGTSAGTHQVDLPLDNITDQPLSIQGMGDKLLIETGPLSILNQSETSGSLAPVNYWLTDGTAAGTTEVSAPTGATGESVYVTSFAPDSIHPDGTLAFLNSGKLWVADVLTGQSAWVDPTGLPTGYTLPSLPSYFNIYYFSPAYGFAEGYNWGTYFDGALYFSAANGSQHAQLWEWNLPVPTTTSPPVTPPVVPPVAPPVVDPAVTSVVVNNGQVQRSMVTSLTVNFNRQVDLEPGAVSVTSSTGQSIGLSLNPQTVNGETVLAITFIGTGVIGGSVPDGRYTLTITGADVIDAATGGVMQGTSTTAFTRLFGDLLGTGTYDPAARWMAQDALGQTIGSPGYIAALDWNGDGVIDEADILAVVRNWGKSLPPA